MGAEVTTTKEFDDYLEYGECLEDLLKRREIRPADLAELIGCDVSYVRMWIRSDRVPPMDNPFALLIPDVLNLSASERQHLHKAHEYSLVKESLNWLSHKRARTICDYFWKIYDKVKGLLPFGILSDAQSKVEEATSEVQLLNLTDKEIRGMLTYHRVTGTTAQKVWPIGARGFVVPALGSIVMKCAEAEVPYGIHYASVSGDPFWNPIPSEEKVFPLTVIATTISFSGRVISLPFEFERDTTSRVWRCHGVHVYAGSRRFDRL